MNLPDREEQTEDKHGDAPDPALLLIVGKFGHPISSTHDIGKSCRVNRWHSM